MVFQASSKIARLWERCGSRETGMSPNSKKAGMLLNNPKIQKFAGSMSRGSAEDFRNPRTVSYRVSSGASSLSELTSQGITSIFNGRR